jgi:hypothetical protein
VKEALVRNAADPVQVGKARTSERDRRSQELADFIMIMRTEYGRRFMWRMLDITGFQKSSFTGNSHTFFNEGQRNIGLILWADMNEGCPELYAQMLNEATKKEAQNA